VPFASWDVVALALMAGIAWLLLVLEDWRSLLISLAALEAALGSALLAVWGPTLVVMHLLAGWLAAAMLGLGQTMHRRKHPAPRPLTGRVVRGLAGVLTLALVFSVGPVLARAWPTVPEAVRWAAAATALLGLMQTAWSRHPLRLSIGLLTVLAGFAPLFAWQHADLLTTGWLAGFQLLLAWSGSYLLHQTAVGEEAL